MGNSINNIKATVKRSDLKKTNPQSQASSADAILEAGGKSPEVTASPLATAALAAVGKGRDDLRSTLTSHAAIFLSYRASAKKVRQQSRALAAATGEYADAVERIAGGDAAVIARAGLPALEGRTGPVALGMPLNVRGGPADVSQEAIVRFDAAPGAKAYKLRVNFTPSTPGAWTELASGSARRRRVKAPAPGAQFLVSVCAIGGAMESAWTEPVFVTAR